MVNIVLYFALSWELQTPIRPPATQNSDNADLVDAPSQVNPIPFFLAEEPKKHTGIKTTEWHLADTIAVKGPQFHGIILCDIVVGHLIQVFLLNPELAGIQVRTVKMR